MWQTYVVSILKTINLRLFLLLISWLVGCTPSPRQLAQKYCGGCHQFPEPSLLDSASWEQVFPLMGPRLGILSYNYPVLDKNLCPSKPVLSLVEWSEILHYYRRAAPKKLIEKGNVIDTV